MTKCPLRKRKSAHGDLILGDEQEMVGRKGNLGETTNSAKSFLSSNQFLLVPYLIIWEMFVWKEHISISPGVQWCEIRRRSSSRFSKRLRRSMKGKHQPSIFSVSKNHILTCQRIVLHFKTRSRWNALTACLLKLEKSLPSLGIRATLAVSYMMTRWS